VAVPNLSDLSQDVLARKAIINRVLARRDGPGLLGVNAGGPLELCTWRRPEETRLRFRDKTTARRRGDT